MTPTTFAWKSRAILPLALLLGFASAPASAALQTYGFDGITNNLAGDVAIGETQLFVDVTNNGLPATQTAFTFRNTGPLASSITDIYFDDGTLLGIASITDSGAGVAFSEGANPADLPGGNSIIPQFDATFSADSDAPAQPNGVNPGEFVTIVFNLINGQSFDDVIAALAADALRIGIHVQGFASGGSESFINGDCIEGCDDIPGEVPEPASLALLGLGMAGLAAIRRRRIF